MTRSIKIVIINTTNCLLHNNIYYYIIYIVIIVTTNIMINHITTPLSINHHPSFFFSASSSAYHRLKVSAVTVLHFEEKRAPLSSPRRDGWLFHSKGTHKDRHSFGWFCYNFFFVTQRVYVRPFLVDSVWHYSLRILSRHWARLANTYRLKI